VPLRAATIAVPDPATPARAAIASGAKQARKMRITFAVSSMPNQMTISGR